MQLLSVTVLRGNAEMYRRSGLVISREQGVHYDSYFAVPVLMSRSVMDFGCCRLLCWLCSKAERV